MGSPKKTSSKKRGEENRDEPGPSKQRDSENFTDSISTFDNSPMLKRPKKSKYFQTSKNSPQPNDNDESEREITGEIYVNRLSKQTRTPWTKEEDLKLIAGMKLFKNSTRWISIKNKFFKDSHRTHINIKDRRRTLVNNGSIDKND